MARIFINYRRDDSQGVAGRLFDHLASKYSRGELFMDVDTMQPGIDFTKQIDTQVSQCQVLLAVIGPHWLEARDQAGSRRLDSDKDYVRLELASALKRDIAVIPVLLDGAVMPSEDLLPDELKTLARRHAIELRHTRFNADADAIMQALETIVPRSRIPRRLLVPGALAVACIVVAAVVGMKLLLKPRAPPPPQPPAIAAAPAVQHPPELPAPAPSHAAIQAQPNTAASGVIPPGVALGQVLPGVAFLGSILRVTEITPDPLACQAACRAEARCAVWTYTQPSASNPAAHCSLKTVIPVQVSDVCCTSGIEREPPPEMREPPPVSAAVTGAERGIELQGGTYHYFDGADATAEACQAACRADGQCLAWDYMRPGIAGPDAFCFLKNRTSRPVASPCCIAGFERQVASVTAPSTVNPAVPTANTGFAATGAAVAPAPAPGPLFRTNLFGSDYRHADLSADDWAPCQALCKADSQCVAWTLVHAGVQGPSPRCWLKNRLPQPRTENCCISGIERAQAQ